MSVLQILTSLVQPQRPEIFNRMTEKGNDEEDPNS